MNKAKIRALTVPMAILLAIAVLTGCGGTPAQPAKQEQKAAEPVAATSGLKAAEFEQPMLITCIGQSADGQMVKALTERAGLKFDYNTSAKPENLAGMKTLVLVIGGSSKGMGAAGVNMDQEEKRARELIAKAKAGNIKVIAMHVGGASRRGELTNRFIPLLQDAHYAIVVADGDNDKAFSKAAGNKTPIDFPANVTEVGKYLKAAFK